MTEVAIQRRAVPPPLGRKQLTGVDFGPELLDLDIEIDLEDVMPGEGRTFPVSRFVSFAALGFVAVSLYHAGRAGYYLATDVQVAPFMLTPDSEQITTSRLSLTSLITERESAGAHREVLEQQLGVTRESLARLNELHNKVQSAVGIAHELTLNSERTSLQELQKLLGQKAVLEGALDEQTTYISEVHKRVESGLAHTADLVRERAELRRLKLLQLQRERDQVSAENRVRELSLTKTTKHGKADKVAPDVLRLEEQLLRLELEIRSLEADEHGKLAELAATKAQTERLDTLIAQLKQRPLYRAIENKQTLAFVPYTQHHGVHPSAQLFECKLWSMFYCERVGQISEILPGEISATDPWGSPARGEYAVMELSEPSAVTAKTLRVRDEKPVRSLWSFWKRSE